MRWDFDTVFSFSDPLLFVVGALLIVRELRGYVRSRWGNVFLRRRHRGRLWRQLLGVAVCGGAWAVFFLGNMSCALECVGGGMQRALDLASVLWLVALVQLVIATLETICGHALDAARRMGKGVK